MTIELNKRDDISVPYVRLLQDLELPDVMHLASELGTTIDVMRDGEYLVTYCGSSPYWWPLGESMHQISSHGWCHDCHKDEGSYVHHLDIGTEIAVLTCEARWDRVLRRQCEADGLTPEQYAEQIAGRAVPLEGDWSFSIDVVALGSDLEAGTADFGVTMWAGTCVRVTVPLAEGAEQAAVVEAEQLAHSLQPKRCYDCHGTRGHARNCSVTREAEFLAKYPHLKLDGE